MRHDLEIVREQNEQFRTRLDRLQIFADRKSCGYTWWLAELKRRTEELQNRLSQWLCIPDPSTNYHTALQKRHPETGRWLLNGQHFADWKSSTSSLMWLHGSGTSRLER